MIIDVPTSDELAQSSVELLNLAWETIFEVIDLLDESYVKEWDDDGEARKSYHTASQPSLRNAFQVIQQAQELGIKSRIAAVSPYLLLYGNTRDWPRHSEDKDTPFTEFRTIDASDLIKVHNSVCNSKFDQSFVSLFNETRKKRNVLHISAGPVQILTPENCCR